MRPATLVRIVACVPLTFAQNPDADRLLSTDPFALLTGMLLDQQFPMERAFTGPYLLAARLGDPTTLDPAVIIATNDQTLKAAAQGPPAIHRYPGSMAERIKALAHVVVDAYDGDASRIWSTGSGPEVLKRLKSLPGFGEQKAKIFLALTGKRLGIQPTGWRAACAPYGDPGSKMSIADVTDATTLAEVRAFKKQNKASARA